MAKQVLDPSRDTAPDPIAEGQARIAEVTLLPWIAKCDQAVSTEARNAWDLPTAIDAAFYVQVFEPDSRPSRRVIPPQNRRGRAPVVGHYPASDSLDLVTHGNLPHPVVARRDVAIGPTR